MEFGTRTLSAFPRSQSSLYDSSRLIFDDSVKFRLLRFVIRMSKWQGLFGNPSSDLAQYLSRLVNCKTRYPFGTE